MKTAIRKSLPDFIAVALLTLVALAVGYYILQEQRLRIPVLEERPYELKAEMETAQGVVAGQGQTIRIAGVRIGDVEDVELENGVAVVTFGIRREYLPIYKDATLLMRPATGLKDMFFDLDPGTPEAGEFEEGSTIPVSNTAPDVNLDELLEALDADTQAYLKLLIVSAGKGLDGRAKELGRLLGSLGPINEDLARLNRQVATRRQNLRTLVHNFNELTGAIAKSDEELNRLIISSETALEAIAVQDPSVQRAISLLPGTLQQAQETLVQATAFAQALGPAVNELRPFVRALPAMNASLTQLAGDITPVLEDEIRPFVRSAREPIDDLRLASERLADATPGLTVVGKKLNRLGNMATYNPNGAEPVGTANRDEGYLYWAAWLGHNGNGAFQAADANGLYRRIYLTMPCSAVASILSSSPLSPIITGLGPLVAPTGPCA